MRRFGYRPFINPPATPGELLIIVLIVGVLFAFMVGILPTK